MMEIMVVTVVLLKGESGDDGDSVADELTRIMTTILMTMRRR